MRRLPVWLRGLIVGALALWVFVALFPFLWMSLMSLRVPVDAFSVPPRLIAPVTFDNFYQLWVVEGFWRYGVNTVIVTVATMAVSLTIGCLAGYALARYRGSLGFWLLIFRAMPQVVLLTSCKPAFFELGIWSRYETLVLVLVAVNQPFTIWMLRSFFLNIPSERTRRRWSTAAPGFRRSGT